MIVYVVQNQTNNKVYVGQTTRAFARRWQGIPNIRIAQIFKVEPNTISRVVSGKRWSHTLPEELKGADLRRFNYMG